MSMVFARDVSSRQKVSPGHSTVQKLLFENAALIQTIIDFQNMGRVQEAAEYQQTLHRNLFYLANLADDAQSLLAELQTPPDQTTPATNVQQPSATLQHQPSATLQHQPTATLQHQPTLTMPSIARSESQPITTEKTANGTQYYASENQPTSQYQHQQQQAPSLPPTSVHQLNPGGSMGPPQIPPQVQQQQPPPVSVPYTHQQSQGGQASQSYVPPGPQAGPPQAYPPPVALPQPNQAQMYSQAGPPTSLEVGPPPHLYSQAVGQNTLYSQATTQAGMPASLYAQAGPPSGPQTNLYPQTGAQSMPQAAYQQQQQYFHNQCQQPTYGGSGGPQAAHQYSQQPQVARSQQQQVLQGPSTDGAYYTNQGQQQYQQPVQTSGQPQQSSEFFSSKTKPK